MGIESLPKFVLALAAALVSGWLGIWLVFLPDNFKAWAVDHLDRNSSTGEEMTSLSPRTTYWDWSEVSSSFYRVVGLFPLAIALLLFTGVIYSAIVFVKAQ